MRLLKVLALRGPNIWSRHTIIEAWVDLGPLRDLSSERFPGFNDRLMAWLPSLIEHRCSVGERGGFYQRLRRGTYLAHILEHTTLELQTLAGTPVGFGKARETSQEGVYKVAIRYQEEVLGRECLDVARALLMAAVFDQPFEIDVHVNRLRQLADRVCLGPSSNAIVDAAKARNIPVRRLNSRSLVQLGQGVRQRRIWTAETDNTSAIAESIAQDKDLTKKLLRSAGIPVPEGREVESPEDAWEAAQELKGSVVVKPTDGNHGRGVFTDLTEEQQIKTAYLNAIDEGSGVLVERFASGLQHRLLVVGGKLVAAARGDTAEITGDGQHTIAELLDSQINADPRRGEDEASLLDMVEIDSLLNVELMRQGYAPESIPVAGVRVTIRRHDTPTVDVTDLVHPSIAEHAVQAAQVVGLDIAGLDIVAEDIGRPLEDQGGVVVEVNAGPGLLMHLRPTVGKKRPVGEAILATLFPNPEDNGRIPVVSVTGTNGKTTCARLVTSILKSAGYFVGMTCTDGVTVDGRVIDQGDCAGPRSAKNVLLNPLVDAAVFESARGGILREGLGVDKCDVAIVTNIGEADHLGKAFIDSPEDMFKVKRTPSTLFCRPEWLFSMPPTHWLWRWPPSPPAESHSSPSIRIIRSSNAIAKRVSALCLSETER
jgi:cyanophycin synthetase